jgi:glucose/arabinose dehydrogenase
MIGRRLLRRPCVNLEVSSNTESGALGIALDPRFRRNHRLYVFYTNDEPRENRVTRYVVENNRYRNPQHILTDLQVARTGRHNGGQLEFVRRKLFVSVGVNHRHRQAQNTNNTLGKILRINRDGSIPEGNPFSTQAKPNPVWSFGHRNPFGLTHKPGTRKLYETENGPTCDDELNLIKRGENYGWGRRYECGTAGVGPSPRRPLVRWADTIGVTDPWWYQGRLRSLRGDIYVGAWNSGELFRIHLNRRGTRARWRRVIYISPNAIVDVSKGPGRWLYFITPSAIFRIVSR